MRTRRIAYEPTFAVVMSLVEITVAMVENDHSHFRNKQHLLFRDREAILFRTEFPVQTPICLNDTAV